tara:strand:+ start:75 stop:608 length:534 start_codon:yes stop_codon:yes gene_type:complete
MSQQSFVETAGNGGSISFSLDTSSQDEINVAVDGLLIPFGAGSLPYQSSLSNYSSTGGQINWTATAPSSSNTVRIFRKTDIMNTGNTEVEGKATYTAGSSVKAADLNNNTTQVLRAVQDLKDQIEAVKFGIFNTQVVFTPITTTERNALNALEGGVIYNSTTNKLQVYNGSSWIDLH